MEISHAFDTLYTFFTTDPVFDIENKIYVLTNTNCGSYDFMYCRECFVSLYKAAIAHYPNIYRI